MENLFWNALECLLLTPAWIADRLAALLGPVETGGQTGAAQPAAGFIEYPDLY